MRKEMIYTGNCLDILPTLDAESVQCCVTSPPYWGLRDYGVDGQLGLEKTPEEYVAKMVEVFREVRRVLKKGGTCWINLGDSYASSPPGNKDNKTTDTDGVYNRRLDRQLGHGEDKGKIWHKPKDMGLKPKDLVGIPWRVAFALQADGWYLRQDIIWNKPNPMPESVTDRCTKAHEYIFLLTKSARYYYDAEAVKEENITGPRGREKFNGESAVDTKLRGWGSHCGTYETGRNRRSVWTITTKPFKEAHFATFPPEIPEICIKAGSRAGDTILDPFAGAGTTGLVAEKLGRKFVGIELNPEYVDMAERRIEAARLPLMEAL